MDKERRENLKKLSMLEARVYTIIVEHLEETGETIGNRQIANMLDISRSRVGETRKSLASKIDSLQRGF